MAEYPGTPTPISQKTSIGENGLSPLPPYFRTPSLYHLPLRYKKAPFSFFFSVFTKKIVAILYIYENICGIFTFLLKKTRVCCYNVIIMEECRSLTR